jgi:prepilin-type N-terminal cleavage/methylation domain-containing protein
MKARLRSERGFALVETLVAVAVLSSALVVFLAGLSTGSLSTAESDRLSTAHEVARSQMELTKAASYSAAPYSYPTVTPPATYGVSAAASAISGGDANIERITVTVTKDSVAVFSLEGFKANR